VPAWGHGEESGRRTSLAGAVGDFSADRVYGLIITVCCPEDLFRFAEPADEFWISNLAKAEDPFFEHAIPALMLQATACTHLARGLAYTLRPCKI
jgi:hypothetical protein